MYSKEQIKHMPILDSIVCNYGNHKPNSYHRYRVAYDCCGEFACIELIAPNLDSIIIYLNSMGINVTASKLNSIETNNIWSFNANAIEYFIYKLDKYKGTPQQFYAG